MNSSGGTLRYIKSFTNPVNGNMVTVHESKLFTPTEQNLEWNFYLEETDSEGRLVSKSCIPLFLHYFNRFEMQYLLELCGFEIEALYGDFQRGPFVHGGEQVWIATKNAV